MARILIIEDNPANMKLACLLLRNAGHTVLCAVDAESRPDAGARRAARPDPDGHPAARHGRPGGDGAAEAGPGDRRHSGHRADRDGDEGGPGKDARSPAATRTSPSRCATRNCMRRSTRLLASAAHAAAAPTMAQRHDRPAATHPHRRRRDPEPQAARSAAAARRLSSRAAPPAAKRRWPRSREQRAGPDPARHHDAGHGRLRGGQHAQGQPRHVEHSDHHGDGADRPRRPPGGPECRGGRIPHQAGRPRRTVAAGAQPAAPEGTRRLPEEPQRDPGAAGAGAHQRPACA